MKMIPSMKIMKLNLIMKTMNMMKSPLSLIQGPIIMKFCILTQWMMMPKRKIKAVKTPEMSQNMSQMDRQRLNAQHRLITSKGQ